ncbi:MAG: peptidylprolyl isomerase [Bernardetiaceae bacterium]
MSIKKGDQIAVHYTGKFTNGTVFDSSLPRQEPLKFTVGAGQMIKGFDQAVLGMQLNEEKTVTLPPEEAYGIEEPDNFVELPNSRLPEGMSPEVGETLTLSTQNGEFQVRVHACKADSIVLNANHPMAGKTLVFDIKIMEINPGKLPEGVNLLPDW